MFRSSLQPGAALPFTVEEIEKAQDAEQTIALIISAPLSPAAVRVRYFRRAAAAYEALAAEVSKNRVHILLLPSPAVFERHRLPPVVYEDAVEVA